VCRLSKLSKKEKFSVQGHLIVHSPVLSSFAVCSNLEAGVGADCS